ncbi:MAG: asparagine synthase (glutamine-hydrolyzing), partial [Pirellulaceae bacterium]
MCGIVGTTDRRDHRSLGAMLGLMRHRGPDDAGRYVDDATGVAIAMRRLSILDVHSGHQPMSNEDGTIWIVFNGEIYNAPELRRELEQKGHIFRTRHSDTECLVHLFEDYGAGMLARLNGMFAFVIYDARRRCLFGARDRAGIKPLYYVERQGRFAFASELKCLRVLPDVSSALDPASLMHYLSLQFVPAPRTALRDVRKLPAGFCFHYHLEQRSLVTERYWHLPVRPRHDRSREEVVAELRARLEQAVLRQTLSDVPIACSLSGGLDSSAIVGILAQHSGERLRTYSVGFAGPGTDTENELPLAREVAALWQTDHTEIIVEPNQVLQDLHRMVYHLDEPYGGSLPSWYIFEAVGRDCKVALTGTGGDELFGNYQKWKVHEHGGLRRVWDICRQAFRWGQAGILIDGWRYPQGVLYHQYLPDAVKSRLLRLPAARERSGPTASLLQAHWNGASMTSPRDTVACMDFQL